MYVWMAGRRWHRSDACKRAFLLSVCFCDTVDTVPYSQNCRLCPSFLGGWNTPLPKSVSGSISFPPSLSISSVIHTPRLHNTHTDHGSVPSQSQPHTCQQSTRNFLPFTISRPCIRFLHPHIPLMQVGVDRHLELRRSASRSEDIFRSVRGREGSCGPVLTFCRGGRVDGLITLWVLAVVDKGIWSQVSICWRFKDHGDGEDVRPLCPFRCRWCLVRRS